MTSLRFGLAGTGHWAQIAHAPALASTEGVELTAVWGRNQQATAELAAGHRAAAYHNFTAFLAAVDAVTAEAGLADVTHLILHHEGGASSTVTATLSAPENAARFEAYVWGAAGRLAAPGNEPDRVAALRTALVELAANARSGQIRHACDVWFGREVGRVLTEAQRQLDAERSGPA